MTALELFALGLLLFFIAASVSFLVQWRRAEKSLISQAGLDWRAISLYAMIAVKDAEQLWLKEGLDKKERLEHALSILMEAYPQLAEYENLAAAFIREAVYNMNRDKPTPDTTVKDIDR